MKESYIHKRLLRLHHGTESDKVQENCLLVSAVDEGKCQISVPKVLEQIISLTSFLHIHTDKPMTDQWINRLVQWYLGAFIVFGA